MKDTGIQEIWGLKKDFFYMSLKICLKCLYLNIGYCCRLNCDTLDFISSLVVRFRGVVSFTYQQTNLEVVSSARVCQVGLVKVHTLCTQVIRFGYLAGELEKVSCPCFYECHFSLNMKKFIHRKEF